MRYMITRSNPWFDPFFDDEDCDWNAVSDVKFPPVDVWEDANQFVLEAELAGYQESDLDLHVDNHTLHLSSKRRMDKKDHAHYLLQERGWVPFERTFSLPENVDESAIKADFQNGVLSIRIPKIQPAQPKLISVRVN